MSNKPLTIDEAAAELRISIHTIRRRIKDGTFTPLNYCRRYLFPVDYIESLKAIQNTNLKDGNKNAKG